ncbi:Xaa-Pro dipeptidase [Arenimonas fontis]|uniref:Xaa-Pro dipeptidase n=1 Tax=Arenimonas fontis TaxID=2608255 RepID=A0A5B2ZCN6_9GAMM|nr:Xaa-Pro dipeptidase [Arenimonas fontis]KAA2285333.1 Xaa-Pro dipeptidase [Arenimonas fontis]
MSNRELATLYRAHLETIKARVDRALQKSGFDHLLVTSGVEKHEFLDDRPYPFKVNAQFKAWLPLTRHPHCWLAYTPGRKPVLAYYQPDDYWHVPPAAPEGVWLDEFDIRVVRDPAEAAQHLPREGRRAIIGEADAALPGFEPNNPKALLDYLHYHRAYKTPYELDRMRAAQRRAVPGHRAAREAFLAGASEAQIHAAYLAATGHSDLDLPYNNIVGLNEHAATLHYQYKQTGAPARSLSLLIDAGAEVDGYASDITRTWGNGDGGFAELLQAVDAEQQALCAGVRAGTDYRQLHLQCHLRLGGVLRQLGIVAMDPDEMLATGVSATFFPHGLGHPIGLQVHDVAGLSDEDGRPIPRPEGHPFLRMTRTLEPGMVVTIEPGLYFIPTLLAKLKQTPQARHVDWNRVEQLLPYGGVRIEDEVHCTDGDPENLTRAAFAGA